MPERERGRLNYWTPVGKQMLKEERRERERTGNMGEPDAFKVNEEEHKSVKEITS